MRRLNGRRLRRITLSSTFTTVPVGPAAVGVHRQLENLPLAPPRMQSRFMAPSGTDVRMTTRCRSSGHSAFEIAPPDVEWPAVIPVPAHVWRCDSHTGRDIGEAVRPAKAGVFSGRQS